MLKDYTVLQFRYFDCASDAINQNCLQKCDPNDPLGQH